MNTETQPKNTEGMGAASELSAGLGAWIPVTERLPKGGFPVLVACGKKVLRAAHAGKFELDEKNWGWFNDGDGSDYNEENDTSYWPEGWYEWNEHEEIHWQLDNEPTHWMPLPEAPNARNHGLPIGSPVD